ncbi:MAG: hypothetical protein OHK0023_06790 [Anaerolineae bacterium]
MLRFSLTTDLGRELAARYGVDFVPQFILFDAAGKVTLRTTRVPSPAQVLGQ